MYFLSSFFLILPFFSFLFFFLFFFFSFFFLFFLFFLTNIKLVVTLLFQQDDGELERTLVLGSSVCATDSLSDTWGVGVDVDSEQKNHNCLYRDSRNRGRKRKQNKKKPLYIAICWVGMFNRDFLSMDGKETGKREKKPRR